MSVTHKTITPIKNDYNGWTNYATWRINLELFNDMNVTDYFDEFPTIEMLEDYVENIVFENNGISGHLGLMEDYARAFLCNVNYYEILEHTRENYEYDKTAKNEE